MLIISIENQPIKLNPLSNILKVTEVRRSVWNWWKDIEQALLHGENNQGTIKAHWAAKDLVLDNNC